MHLAAEAVMGGLRASLGCGLIETVAMRGYRLAC